MLRKFVYNKIFRTTGMLLLFLLFLLFPVSKKYSLEDEMTIKTSTQIKQKEVFLLDKDGYIARTKVNLICSDSYDCATKILELLILDGKYENNIPNGFRSMLPSELKINSININKDEITVDFSSSFNEISKENEKKAIELITYNLTTINGIKKVYINVEGKRLDKLNKCNMILKQPFTRSDGINVVYDAPNYKNTNMVTVYYINKNNTGNYYVPVTKVTNDNREKIRVIIDELTSSNIYQTNLMSFLNYNTKLINYNLNGEILTLNFNDFLFNDNNSNIILEEVIYSIALSIRDNYDVKEVIFNVDGKEITKSVIKNVE